MKNVNKKLGVVSCLALIASLSLAGCAPSSYDGAVYSGNQAKTVRNVSYGKIVSIREVKIKEQSATSKILGAGGGGAIGGIAASTIGNGKGKTLATVVGAIGGAIIGNNISEAVSTEKAYEIEVKRDNGYTFVVVQGINNATRNEYYPGRQVAIIGSGDNISVSPR